MTPNTGYPLNNRLSGRPLHSQQSRRTYHCDLHRLHQGPTHSGSFLDFRKAFDSVWHNALLYKLFHLKLSGNMLAWIAAFLFHRKYRVRTFQAVSHPLEFNIGVPQGSVLRTLLFRIFINDITETITTDYSLYADDIVIWSTNTDPTAAIRNLNNSLQRLSDWSSTWRLPFSPQKCSWSLFTKSTALLHSTLPPLHLYNTTLHYQPHQKYIRMWFDRSLNWHYHISKVSDAANRKLNFRRSISHRHWGLCRQLSLKVYTSYIRPTIEYASSIYISAAPSTLHHLDTIQATALPIVTATTNNTPHSILNSDTRTPPLSIRRLNNLICDLIRPTEAEPPTALTHTFQQWRNFTNTHPLPPTMPSFFCSANSAYITHFRHQPPLLSSVTTTATAPLLPQSSNRSLSSIQRNSDAVSSHLHRQWLTTPTTGHSAAFYSTLQPTPQQQFYYPLSASKYRNRLIFRLRSGYNSLLAHQQRASCDISCPNCSSQQDTIDHLLFQCPTYQQQRRMLMTAITQTLNTNNISTIFDIPSTSISLTSTQTNVIFSTLSHFISSTHRCI